MRIWNSLLPCRHIALNLIFFMISGFFLKYFLQWTLLAYFWTVNFYSLTLTVHPVLLVYFIGPNAAISNLLCEVSTWENYSFWCWGLSSHSLVTDTSVHCVLLVSRQTFFSASDTVNHLHFLKHLFVGLLDTILCWFSYFSDHLSSFRL